MLRCAQVKTSSPVIVATTVREEDDPIADLTQRLGFGLWRGSETDVLDRYVEAARAFELDAVVRITSDCPLIDPGLIGQVLKVFLTERPDIAANIVERTLPRGFDTEIVSAACLQKLLERSPENFHREHVTPYFYEHPEKYRIVSVRASEERLRRPDLRLCIDTPEDYELLIKIFERLPDGEDFNALDIIRLFEENPDWVKINESVAHLKKGGKT